MIDNLGACFKSDCCAGRRSAGRAKLSDNEPTRRAPGIVQPRDAVTDAELRAEGIDLPTDFPGSSADDFRRYPVLSEGGWFMVIKHQRTLQSVSRKPWRLLGPVPLVSEGLALD